MILCYHGVFAFVFEGRRDRWEGEFSITLYLIAVEHMLPWIGQCNWCVEHRSVLVLAFMEHALVFLVCQEQLPSTRSVAAPEPSPHCQPIIGDRGHLLGPAMHELS